jgi:hypothetical protein
MALDSRDISKTPPIAQFLEGSAWLEVSNKIQRERPATVHLSTPS